MNILPDCASLLLKRSIYVFSRSSPGTVSQLHHTCNFTLTFLFEFYLPKSSFLSSATPIQKSICNYTSASRIPLFTCYFLAKSNAYNSNFRPLYHIENDVRNVFRMVVRVKACIDYRRDLRTKLFYYFR